MMRWSSATLNGCSSLSDKGMMEEAVVHDIKIKTPLFQRRGELIRKTGNAAMALNSMTDASVFPRHGCG